MTAATFTLTSKRFPNGTTVKCYPTTNWPTPGQPSGAPIGSSAAEASMTAGTLTFTGLTKGTKYWAAAEVAGAYRYVKFIAGEDSSEAASHATLDAEGKLEASELPSSVVTDSTKAGGDLSGTFPNPTIPGSHGLTPGQIIVANAGGDAVAQALSGEASITSGGVLTLDGVVFNTYKVLRERGGLVVAEAVAGTYPLASNTQTVLTAATSDTGGHVFYFAPEDFTAGSRKTKLRIRAHVLCNATAPVSNFTVGLYPVSAVAGGGGTISLTLGTVVEGSTKLFEAPAKESKTVGVSSVFEAPAAGFYVLGVVTSAKTVASSKVNINAALQMKQE